jgi:predicted DNA-binding transcriptional regulator AlpA
MEIVSKNVSNSASYILSSDDRLINKEQVLHIVGFKKSLLYELIKKGSFPQPFKIGIYKTIPRWSEVSVRNWLVQTLQGKEL